MYAKLLKSWILFYTLLKMVKRPSCIRVCEIMLSRVLPRVGFAVARGLPRREFAVRKIADVTLPHVPKFARLVLFALQCSTLAICCSAAGRGCAVFVIPAGAPFRRDRVVVLSDRQVRTRRMSRQWKARSPRSIFTTVFSPPMRNTSC